MDSPAASWLDEPITMRRYITELILDGGGTWWQANEAVASAALESPGPHWDVVRTRQEWADQDGDL